MANNISRFSWLYYLAGLPLVFVLFPAFSGNPYVGIAMVALALLVDMACFAIVFLTTGRAMQLLGTPYRQLTYTFSFLVLAVFPVVIFAVGVSFTETLSAPFLGIDFLSGKTFDHGIITPVGFLIVTFQVLLSALLFLIPRELIQFLYVNLNREK